MTKAKQLPTALPSGDLMPHMSARYRTATIDALFHASGGFDRALAWIEKSDDNFGVFFKDVWARGAAKATSVEHTASEGVEAMLEKLDRADRAKLIDGDAIDVTPSGGA